jgi:hypothetical protein
MKAPTKKRGRPRTKEIIPPPKAWSMVIQYRPGCETVMENIPGSWSEDEAIQKFGVPRNAKIYRVSGQRRTIIQHPR